MNPEEKYLQECRENAIRKKKTEIELLHTKCVSIPVESSIFENYVYFNSSPGTLESYELVMEWIRDIRLGSNYKNMLYHQISSHEGFIGLYALNSLRKNKNPNFLYFHGIVEIKGKENNAYPMSPKRKEKLPDSPKYDFDDIMRTQSTFYTLSEDLFIDKDIFRFSLRDVCQKENWIVIMGYFLSLIFSLYNANTDINYTNYDLNVDNIMMRDMESSIFDVEYDFGDRTIWITNYGYIPTITRFSKSYTKISIEGGQKSFGYNNLSQLPFEEKGIYCDRGFVISDAYSLLMGILESTIEKNNEVYRKFSVLLSYFTQEDPRRMFSNRYFLPYYNSTKDLNIYDFIQYILKVYPEFNVYKSKNDVLHCIGSSLEIKSKSIEYYTIKNTIQLYDLIKYYSSFMNVDNNETIIEVINKSIGYYTKFFEKENIIKDIERQGNIEFILNNHFYIFEVPETTELFTNKKYSGVLIEYFNHCILYFNTWERLKISIKMMKFLESSSSIFKELCEKYNEVFENNKEYYDCMYQNLNSFRSLFRRNLEIFPQYKKQILFLECLE